MEIKSNGVNKEVKILKHFKISDDEFILYKDGELISLGQIIDNKINIPTSDKIEVIKKIIANFISSSPDNRVNNDNNCIVLSNNLDDEIEEISAQHIKLTDQQLGNLTHEKDLSNVEYKPMYTNFDDKKSKGGLIKLIIVLIIIASIGAAGFMFKDKIKSFVKNINIPKVGQSSKENNTTGNKKETKKTADPKKEIINAYNYMANNNYNKFINSCPNDLKDYYKKVLTEAVFKESSNNLINEVGTNIKVKADVIPQKVAQESLNESSLYFQQDTGKNITLSECYSYTGTVTISGSKGEKVLTEKDLSTTWYCKVNGDWGFIFG